MPIWPSARGRGPMSLSRILVIEDNALNPKLVRDVLEYAGYDVLEADDGRGGHHAWPGSSRPTSS